MFGKNRNKKVGLCVMVVTSCFILAGLWAVLAAPETAPAAKKTGGGKKGSGQGALHGCIELRDASGDRVQSDGGGRYCDGLDSTKGGLLEFFRFIMKVKKNGVGRRLFLNFADFSQGGNDNSCLPADENIWILGVNGTLTDWRTQTPGAGVKRHGNLHFGKTGKDEANVSFGRFGVGDPLTVTLLEAGVDVWTIESFGPGEDPDDPAGPGDTAVLWRDLVDGIAVECASGPMPFKVTYEGQ